jgi:hypothetical protein
MRTTVAGASWFGAARVADSWQDAGRNFFSILKLSGQTKGLHEVNFALSSTL